MAEFDIGCRSCPRLCSHLDEIRNSYPDYHAAPVPPFGDGHPKLLIVGLAPGMHGANRTGRPFTGDASGQLLYRTLFDLGLSSAAESDTSDDGLQLYGVRITNAVKCLPPKNAPTTTEVKNCLSFLKREIDNLPARCNLLALGKLAHDAILRSYGMKLNALKFGHGNQHALPDGRALFDSYHCSRYNTQTKRLTAAMFQKILGDAIAPASIR